MDRLLTWLGKWWAFLLGGLGIAFAIITLRPRRIFLDGATRGKVETLRKKIRDAVDVRARLVDQVGEKDLAIVTLDKEIEKNERAILAHHKQITLGMTRDELRERLRKLGY